MSRLRDEFRGLYSVNVSAHSDSHQLIHRLSICPFCPDLTFTEMFLLVLSKAHISLPDVPAGGGEGREEGPHVSLRSLVL